MRLHEGHYLSLTGSILNREVNWRLFNDETSRTCGRSWKRVFGVS